MAATIFTALSNLRMLNNNETDANSPLNETTYAAIRYAIECILILVFGTGISGTASEDPPNDTTGVFTDDTKAWDADVHNSKTLVITSGAAVGNSYTIDDTTATTLVCTADNLYADGVRSGDYYLILYDLKNNEDGHSHDGTNSAELLSATGQDVLAAEDHTAGTEYSHNAASWSTEVTHRVYIPNNADRVRAAIRAKEGGAGTPYLRFTVDGNASNSGTFNDTAYTWVTDCYLDVSELSGWVDLTIDIYGHANVVYVQGYAFIFEAT